MSGIVKKNLLLVCLITAGTTQSLAQSDSSAIVANDSSRTITEVVVSGYGQQLPARLTAAAISIVDSALIGQYSDA